MMCPVTPFLRCLSGILVILTCIYTSSSLAEDEPHGAASPNQGAMRQSGAESRPSEIVRRYLALAASGAHFTNKGRLELARLANSISDNEESVFTTHVISSFRIVSTDCKAETATVTVEFDDIGTLVNDFYEFKPNKKSSRFIIRLKKSSGSGWRITNGPAPTMYEKTVIAHLEQLERHAREVGGNPKHYRNLIGEVRSAASARRAIERKKRVKFD